LYPNPNDGNFQIEFESKTGMDSKISVINSAGMVIKTFTHRTEKGVLKTIRCQLADFIPAGIYTVIIDDGEQRHFKKMTVQKH
jgi:hypothetical protein